ncbi:MAG TPA: hypothetical protein ENI37_02415 [Chloroflexi bacterium]|nr:hypothetical protein [Chloroflexota bacterium]
MNGWHFDPYSAFLGAILTLALIGLGCWLRQPLLRGWQEVRAGLSRSAERLTAGMEGRYREAVIAWAQRAHALAGFGPLERFFLVPRLIPPPPRPDPDAEEEWAAPEPLPLGVALRGHQRLLVVGPLGSGRSTLLAYLALVHARGEAGSALRLPSQRLPLYLHLAGVDWSFLESEEEPEGLVWLAQEGVRTVGGPSAASRVLRQRLQAGTALVLADGWDELDHPERERAAAWLANLTDSLPGNLWLVAVGPRGYGPLTDAGFVPLRLEGWGRSQVETLLACFADLLSPPDEERRLSTQQAADTLAEALKKEHSLLELVLRAWLLMATGEAPERRVDLLMRALGHLLGLSEDRTWLSPVARAALGDLALMMQREGRATVARGEVEAALEAALPPAEECPPRAGLQAFRALTAPGSPLIPRGPGRYIFAHPLWQACLTADRMAASSSAALFEHLNDPRWLPVLDFYAEVGQMGPVVEAWLSEPDDLWRTRLCVAARWTALAPPDAPWRNGVMALLARTFLEPSLPAGVRGRLAEVLAQTGDSGVPLFLRQALRHRQEDVRVTAAQGMGLLREQADLTGLVEALKDPHESVRTAAAAALGHIGTPAAIRRLVEVLVEGEEMLRVEAALGLACAGEAGWEVLREAMEEEDFLTRRAAAYGLGEVGTGWARELLERVARDDEQWIVRSAATAVLSEMEAVHPSPVDPPPVVSELGWLIAWAAERGEGVGVGEAAFGPLLRSLEEGTAPIRRAAAQTLGLVGRSEHVAALRRAVHDPDPRVAQAASWSLEELARRYDMLIR